MDQLKDICIQRFRGINSLQVKDLRRINVFLGNNNCGKSSLLEAILILLGASRPSLPIETNNSRDYNKHLENDIALFFHNLNTDAPIDINASFMDTSIRELSISYYQQTKEINIPLNKLQDKDLSTDPAFTYGLKFEYEDNGEGYKAIMELSTNKPNMILSHSSRGANLNSRVAKFIAPRYNYESFTSSFNKIITDKEKENVLEILRHIEPKIKDIALVERTVMIDVCLEKMIPINVLGDGIRKLFTIILAMYQVKGGTLIIDEVDNGLYHKSMETLWNALLKASADLDVQLFVSTHSQDSLLSLSSALADNFPKMREDVKIFTLRKYDNDNVVAYPYDYESFSHLLNSFIEIR